MSSQRAVRILAMTALAIVIGCSRKPMREDSSANSSTTLSPKHFKALALADEMEVLSIDPFAKVEQGDETYREYRLLGKAAVTDPVTRRSIVDRISESTGSNGEAKATWCFDPRHVVRTKVGGERFDFVICFECLSMHVHSDAGDEYDYYFLGRNAKPDLDEVLRKAGFPIAR